MIVIATQGHDDERAVEQAVAARPAYLGLVGSKRRGAAVLGYLADRGVPGDQLYRVRVPAGLDLGRTTHPEIAVAILAELVQLRAAGAFSSPGQGRAAQPGKPAQARETARPPRPGGTDVAEPAEEATDPVCGMTVAARASGRPLEHAGVTYYFCCAGCRQAFESDPASHARRETRC